MPLPAALEAYWTLDESAGATRDDAIDGDDLVDVGGNVGAAAGKIGGCAVFDGTAGQRLRVNSPSFETAERDWTLALWFYFAANPSAAVETTFLAKGDTGGSATGQLSLSAAFGSLMLRAWSGSALSQDPLAVHAMPAAGAWHHVVCWQDAAAGRLGASLDGAAAVTAAKTLTQTATGVPFALGGIATLGGASAAVKLDEVAFWSRVLSATERAVLYGGGNGLAFPLVTAALAQPSAWARRDGRTWGRTWRWRPTVNPLFPDVLVKTPRDARYYGFDFSAAPEVVAGEALSAPAVHADAGITVGSPAVLLEETDGVAAGEGVAVLISGGSAGASYDVVCTVTTAGGATIECPGRLVVADPGA